MPKNNRPVIDLSSVDSKNAPKVDSDIANWLSDSIRAEQDLEDLRAPQVNQEQGYDQRWQDRLNSVGSSVAEDLGLPKIIPIDDKFAWALDSSTLQYSKVDMSPKLAATLIKGGAIALATAGFGSVLAGSSILSGLGTAAANGIGTAVASGAITAAQGGDLKDTLKSAALGGFAGYAKGASEALKTAQAAGASATAVKGLQATADVANTAQQAVKLATAVNEKDLFSGVSASLNLTGLPSVEEFASSTILDLNPNSTYLIKHSGSLGKATTNFTQKILGGENFEDAMKSSLLTYAKDGGGFKDLLDFDTGSGFNFTVPDIDLGWMTDWARGLELPEGFDIDTSGLRDLGRVIAEGASTINREVIRPVIDTAAQAASAVNREVIKPVTGAVEEGASAINREVIKPVTGAIEEGASAANQFVQRDVIDPIQEALSEVSLPDIDLPSLPDINLPDIDLPSLPDINLPDINLPDVDLPDVDLPSLPDINLPDVDLPDIDLPDVDLPSMDFANFFNLLSAAPSNAGQQVNVLTPEEQELVDIEYLYNFDSIFANPEQEKKYVTPFNQGGIVLGSRLDDLIKLIEGK